MFTTLHVVKTKRSFSILQFLHIYERVDRHFKTNGTGSVARYVVSSLPFTFSVILLVSLGSHDDPSKS